MGTWKRTQRETGTGELGLNVLSRDRRRITGQRKVKR